MSEIIIGLNKQLRLRDVVTLAYQPTTKVILSEAPEFRARILANRAFCEAEITRGADIYGVTTGFGESSRNKVDAAKARELQINLSRYHGCGVGPNLSEAQCAASVLVRLNCNARGYSGVSWGLLERLAWHLNERLIPVIPALGSVGASGDLTPMSYIAAVLQGERQVYADGGIKSATDALASRRMHPYELLAKEGLAIMNGTSVMTAIASLALGEAYRLADLACDLTGLAIEAIDGRAAAFDPTLHELKPHKGQIRAAERIARCISISRNRYTRPRDNAKLQDYYSLRCAPQVIGVLYDVLEWAHGILAIEINSVNDNPVFCDEAGMILSGGNFYGGHVASAADALKTAAANVLNLLDRQLAVLLDSRFNDVLPDNLVDQTTLANDHSLHHGFKAMQITMSALTAEALKASLPMSVFGRPTENSNQDVVSMGTIAARDLAHVLELAKPAVAIAALAVKQAHYLRAKNRTYPLTERSSQLLAQIAPNFEPVVEDRPLEREIHMTAHELFTPAELIACTKP